AMPTGASSTSTAMGASTSPVSPSPALREREGPRPQGGEGEGQGLTRLFARERLVIIVGLAALAVAGWGYLLWLVYGGADMALMGTPLDERWTAVEAGFAFVMWTVMMVAMMLPSAAPVVLLFAALERRQGRLGRTAALLARHLVLWGAFSAVATALPWALQLLAGTNAPAPAAVV